MSGRIGNIIVTAPEPDGVCSGCGLVDEVRPYGPGGSLICYPCGMKDRENTNRRMGIVLFGDTPDERGMN